MPWKKTTCVLCAQNCGLEALVEQNRIKRVRPDRENPKSQGYICRKGLNVAAHQHHAGRLDYPLKRVAGGFERVSWERALGEIAERLTRIQAEHGGDAIAYMGGGGQACHLEAGFGVRLMRALGSRFHYSALAQELTGMHWVMGRTLGRQHRHLIPDIKNADMLLIVGWNGMMSHQIPQARRTLSAFAKDPEKLMVVVDPRASETARLADIHLRIRPGADALFYKALIAIILKEGWADEGYLAAHVSGFEGLRPRFTGFDAAAALKAAGLEYETVKRVAHEFTHRASCLRSDLGILMNRHSTLNSFLDVVLLAVSGRALVKGGNVAPGHVLALGRHTDERAPGATRTKATGFPLIMGVAPPNVLPEEIMSQREDRVRAVLIAGSNPLRSYADTTAYEKAFAQLDLLVVTELAMTETAQLAHYVLPSRSGYESHDISVFNFFWPEVYFQLRKPILTPVGERKEAGQVWVELAEAAGLIPPPPPELVEAAQEPEAFGPAFLGHLAKNRRAQAMAPFLLAQTLGRHWDSAQLAALWGILSAPGPQVMEQARRAGFTGPDIGAQLFAKAMNEDSAFLIGLADEDNFTALATEDGRINLAVPEMAAWLEEIEPEREALALKPEAEFPLLLMAGRHMDTNANTLMRDPAWNQGRRAGTLTMHPDDATRLGLADGARVVVSTQAGAQQAELELSRENHPGQVVMPHGFGLVHQGVKHGPNVNRLTKNTHRDRLAATPYHRWVACRVELAKEEE